MLTIRDLTISYDHSLIEKVNLDLTEGIYGLVGPSGSGKSSLIKALLGFIPYRGELRMNGKLLSDRRGFQVVFQNPFNAFDPKRRIEQALDEMARLNPGSLDPLPLIEECGLSALMLKKFPHELSGGELQRFSIVRALMTRPEVIFFDEPTSALDVVNQKKILDLIRNIKDKIMIFISHDQKVVHYLCDDILILDPIEKTIKLKA